MHADTVAGIVVLCGIVIASVVSVLRLVFPAFSPLVIVSALVVLPLVVISWVVPVPGVHLSLFNCK